MPGKKKKNGSGQRRSTDLKSRLALLSGYREYNCLKAGSVLDVSLHYSTADKAGETRSCQVINIIRSWIWKPFLCVCTSFEQRKLSLWTSG